MKLPKGIWWILQQGNVALLKTILQHALNSSIFLLNPCQITINLCLRNSKELNIPRSCQEVINWVHNMLNYLMHVDTCTDVQEPIWSSVPKPTPLHLIEMRGGLMSSADRDDNSWCFFLCRAFFMWESARNMMIYWLVLPWNQLHTWLDELLSKNSNEFWTQEKSQEG